MATISSASEAKSAPSTAPILPQSPNAWDGTLEDLAARHLIPALPAVDAVLDAHAKLVRYSLQPDTVFLIRHIRGTERRRDYQTRESVRIRATDNSPAWWMYASLRAGHRIAPDAVGAVIETIPCHMFDVAPRSAPVPASAGWHIAHILNVNDRNLDYPGWSCREVVRRFMRNVHPLNYFLLPKRDWRRLGNAADIVDYFAAVHRERYQSIWDEFAELAQFDRPARAGSLGRARVVFGGPASNRSARRAETRSAPPTAGPRTTRRRPRERPSAAPVRADGSEQTPMVIYRATRLTFKRDLIEPLPDAGRFQVQTPAGDFEMTKAEFYAVFRGVTESRSYRDGGIYNMPTPPKRAEQFRL